MTNQVTCVFCKTPIKTAQNSQHFLAIGFANRKCPKVNDSPPPVEDDDIPEPTILDYSPFAWFRERRNR